MISSAIIYLELFIALFFLPGFFITVILGIKKFRFLLSFALSYSLLVLTLLPFEYYAQPIVRWQWCVLLEWVILALGAIVKMFMSWNSKTLNIQRSTSNIQHPRNRFRFKVECWKLSVQSFIHRWLLTIRRLLSPRLIVPLVLAGVICGYLAYAGTYLEIPSDAWTHVFRFQFQKLSAIDQGCFPSGVLFKNLFLPEGAFRYVIHWYFIHAWLCHVSGLSIITSLRVLTFVNVLTFLLGFYFFGLFLFARLRISALKKIMMAAFASLFAAATMGNMVFAYIRYYAFAHAILNYVLFLAAMAVIIPWMRSNRWLGHALWIAPVLIIVTSVIHAQEALFIFFMTLALGFVESVRIIWQKFIYRDFKACPALAGVVVGVACPERGRRAAPGPALKLSEAHTSGPATVVSYQRPNLFSTAGRSVYGSHCSVSEWKSVILAGFLLLVFFAGFAVVRHFKPGSWVSPNMIMPHVSLPPEPVNFIFRNLLISPPENPYLRLVVYQFFVFYQVVGCWGLFVYLLFLLMYRRFVKLPYLTAGMIIVPFLTAFNPLTVDMMVRLGQDPTVYRFHYMIPLPFVGGYLFIHFWEKTREWLYGRPGTQADLTYPVLPRRSWVKLFASILVLAGLIGLVFPINAAGIYAPYSKIYTLRKIPAANDCHLWEDLGKVMEQFENKIILMDCLTRFMIYYSLNNNNCLYSKWLNSRSPEKELPEPYTWESLRNRGLIIINRRDGAPSITGKIAKHWPEDVLKVSRYYSLEAQNYLESHPEKFRKIWTNNRIAVYAVR